MIELISGGGGAASEPQIESDLKGVTKILGHEGTKDYRKSGFSEILQRLHIVTDHSLLTTHYSLKKAFTLAEVLITIAVIGVVAAITLPMILEKLERHKNAIILKRAFSDLQTYISMFDYEYDCSGNFTTCAPGVQELVTLFPEYLVKKQGFKYLLEQDRWAKCKINKNEYGNYEYTKNTLVSPGGNYVYNFVKYPYDLNYNVPGSNPVDYFRVRVDIFTDVPKVYKSICERRICNNDSDNARTQIQEGKNKFMASITNYKKLIASGNCTRVSYYCKTSEEKYCSNTSGQFEGCLGRVINDGWQIKYDY